MLEVGLGKTAGKRRWGQQMMRWLDSITDSMDVSLSKLQGPVEEARCATVRNSKHHLATELQ